MTLTNNEQQTWMLTRYVKVGRSQSLFVLKRLCNQHDLSAAQPELIESKCYCLINWEKPVI